MAQLRGSEEEIRKAKEGVERAERGERVEKDEVGKGKRKSEVEKKPVR